MKAFKVYKHPVFDSETVKDGVSFPVLFFTVILMVQFWMVYKRLWAQFWIWTIYIALMTYFYDSGQLLEWQLDGRNKLYLIGVSILIYILYPFIYGNDWLGKQLEKEGYKLIDTVQAKDKKRAIKIAENNYNNLDEKELGQSGTNNTIPLIIISIVVAIIFISIQ